MLREKNFLEAGGHSSMLYLMKESINGGRRQKILDFMLQGVDITPVMTR
jgi:hypothetical protein